MAKKKGKRSRQTLFNKAKNVGMTLLTVARPLVILFGAGTVQAKVEKILQEATFGFLAPGGGIGSFNLNQGIVFYGPAGAAAAINTILKHAQRAYPIRR